MEKCPGIQRALFGLGAVDRAAQLMDRLVHKISPGDCAQPELSRTPGNFSEPGGRDNEGEAQDTGEPAPPIPELRKRATRRRSEEDEEVVPAKFQFKRRLASNATSPPPSTSSSKDRDRDREPNFTFTVTLGSH